MRIPKDLYVYGDRNFHGRCALEKHEAKTFFALLRLKHPSLGLIAVHVRNEGKRPGWQANQFKREGLVTGTSDIIIPGNPSFVCELKRRDHKQSELTEAQVDYLHAAKANGSFVCIALGADAAMEAVGKWIQLSHKLELGKGLSL